jgi:hypothetical protein
MAVVERCELRVFVWDGARGPSCVEDDDDITERRDVPRTDVLSEHNNPERNERTKR